MECNLRHWKIEDASDLAIALNNKNVLDNLRDGLPYPYSENDARDFIMAMLHADKKTTYAFAITVEDKVVGSIGVFRKNNIHFKTAEMGYYLSKQYWGKGLGTSAVKQVCNYIFADTDIIRIFAEPFAHNVASCRILEKSGFVYEGTLRKNAVKNGIILDMKLYAMIKQSVGMAD
ncbi:MAG: N-acetyltransferase [Clostridia bacterium]|nr:GNAT family protein [Anaerotignum sp.]NCC15802.1 N-acetyltransferase [Clostridia bacterium]